MVKARRRDEWDRWARLLALVDERTIWGDGQTPKAQADWFPPELVTDDERRARHRHEARQRRANKITAAEFAEAAGLKK